MTEEKKRRYIDWQSIEREYRAGIKTLRQLADEFEVSHVAIAKRAKADAWPRDLKAKIDAKAAEKVNRAAVNSEVTKEQLVTEKAVVEANANIMASAELIQREDVILGLDVNRALLMEVHGLSNPKFAEALVALGEAYDESGPGPSGAWKTDKTNELYQYIISLAGRAKIAKDVAAAHTTYINTQRKVLRMEDEANRGQTEAESILKDIESKLGK